MQRKVALITGASRGIGAATAVCAAQQGWDVVLSYQHDHAAAHRVVQAVEHHGGQALAVQADMADEAQLMALFAAVDAHFGQLDALVNNAGVVDVAQKVADYSVARLGAPGQYVDYAAAKGAMDVMTLGLAKEVAAEGIRVNAVRPGLIATDIHASGGQPDRVQRLAPHVPMQRGGSAHEVAQAIVWLMSDVSPYTTGSLLDISGGNL